MTFINACRITEVKSGKGKVVDVNGHKIAIFNDNGNFHAFDNMCPHRKGPLGDGALDGGIVTCPWHGWRFDVKTGKCATMPISLKRYPVKIEGDIVLVDV